MDWEKIKKIFIYILVLVNIGLFTTNYKNTQKYTMTAEEEKAVFKLLSDNNIGVYTNLIKNSPPMRQAAVTVPVFTTEEIRSMFFSPDEEVKITVDFDSVEFKGNEKDVTVTGNSIHFVSENGTGNITEIGRKKAFDEAEKFIESLRITEGRETVPETVRNENDGYRVYFSESFGGEKIFCSFAEVYVTEKGVKEADFTFYDAEGYVGEKKQICSSDEALLTVMYEIKSISDMPKGTYIEKIERGYDFGNENDIADISVIKLVPCYRIYVSSFNEPFIVNAYTNTIMKK